MALGNSIHSIFIWLKPNTIMKWNDAIAAFEESFYSFNFNAKLLLFVIPKILWSMFENWLLISKHVMKMDGKSTPFNKIRNGMWRLGDDSLSWVVDFYWIEYIIISFWSFFLSSEFLREFDFSYKVSNHWLIGIAT